MIRLYKSGKNLYTWSVWKTCQVPIHPTISVIWGTWPPHPGLYQCNLIFGKPLSRSCFCCCNYLQEEQKERQAKYKPMWTQCLTKLQTISVQWDGKPLHQCWTHEHEEGGEGGGGGLQQHLWGGGGWENAVKVDKNAYYECLIQACLCRKHYFFPFTCK